MSSSIEFICEIWHQTRNGDLLSAVTSTPILTVSMINHKIIEQWAYCRLEILRNSQNTKNCWVLLTALYARSAKVVFLFQMEWIVKLKLKHLLSFAASILPSLTKTMVTVVAAEPTHNECVARVAESHTVNTLYPNWPSRIQSFV